MRSSSESLRRLARARGFTLLELVFGFAIVSIFLAMTAVSLKDSVNREGPKALAYTLASDIKSARAEAQRSGQLVAYCLPSEGKTNSFAQAALLRKGQQRGLFERAFGYGREYSGYIFTGSWPGSRLENFELPGDWALSTAGELPLYFRPDGTAFSPDIPSIDGSYAFVVGSKFSSTGGGADGVLTAIENPNTVWVSQSGNISVEEGRVPGSPLPKGGDLPKVASIDTFTANPDPSAPKIADIKFLPEQVSGLGKVGLGQNYVNVHPDQKESERLEYGLATMRIRAKDADGGPVYYKVEALASKGDSGKFSVSRQSGAMDYLYDRSSGQYYWESVVSWRPPPGADEAIEYELQVTVLDEQGRSDTTASGAGLLPVVATLPPVRMVLATSDGVMYLANVEGASLVRLTQPGQAERDPFFSQDGSRIYSFRDVPSGGQQFRVRNADGSQDFRVLRTFSSDITGTLKYDPTYHYVAYYDPGNTTTTPYTYKKEQAWGKGWRLVDAIGYHTSLRLEVLHLLADEPPITISSTMDGGSSYFWDARRKHTIVFAQSLPKGEEGSKRFGNYVHQPGFAVNTQASKLEGFPPVQRSVNPDGAQPSDNRTYNPASENWYLYTAPTGLWLAKTDGSVNSNLTSSALVGRPSWSSDGTQVTYVENLGGSQRVVAKRVLGTDMALKSFVSLYQATGSGLSNPQLAPTGQWIFYQQNGVVYRAVNAAGATKVNISAKTGKAIASYVVSP